MTGIGSRDALPLESAQVCLQVVFRVHT
jgi:hypothetical protein